MFWIGFLSGIVATVVTIVLLAIWAVRKLDDDWYEESEGLK